MIAEQFFKGLGQTSGTMLIASVTIFVDRLDLLEKGAPPFGADGPAARELLAQRGLTAEVAGVVQGGLEQLRNFEVPDLEGSERDAEAAQDAVWNWYREWSRILRHAIVDRRWLRRLGLVSRTSRNEDDDALELPETTEAPDSVEVDEPEIPALSTAITGPVPALGE